MNIAVNHPWVLFLLPFAVLPLLTAIQDPDPYPSLSAAKPDPLSQAVDIGLRVLGSLSMTALVLGLAGLHIKGQTIERTGEGASIVLLFDRSASMNDTFAGQAPTRTGEESKSDAARRFLKQFVATREHDRFGITAFSTAPMFVLPLSDHKDATLAAIDAIVQPGLALTNVGKGLAMAQAMHDTDIVSTEDTDAGVSNRAIVLVSDGAAVIDRKMQQKLEAAFLKRPVNLYWIFLRTEGARGIFDEPDPDKPDTPRAMPERHLNLFFKNLKIPYRAFEVENPSAVGDAIATIDSLERRPMRYHERIPQKDLSGLAYGFAAAALLLLVLARLAEVKVSWPGLRMGRTGLGLMLFAVGIGGWLPNPAQSAEVTREQLLIVLDAYGDDRPDLSRRDLTGLDLSGIDFKKADLFAANLSGSLVQGANFAGANLNRMVANEADFSDADFDGASMFAVVMNGADLTGANLSNTRIIGQLAKARMDNVKLVGADLGADPANQGMVPVRLDMAGASLKGADLTGSNLVHVVLNFADLSDATLVDTRFNWAKLSGADLTGSDVAGADFSNADLEGATLTGLKGADKAQGLPEDAR